MYHRFFIPFICSQELWWFQIQHLETYPVALSLSDWSCLSILLCPQPLSSWAKFPREPLFPPAALGQGWPLLNMFPLSSRPAHALGLDTCPRGAGVGALLGLCSEGEWRGQGKGGLRQCQSFSPCLRSGSEGMVGYWVQENTDLGRWESPSQSFPKHEKWGWGHRVKECVTCADGLCTPSMSGELVMGRWPGVMGRKAESKGHYCSLM